jgi:hypothetical protein
MSNHNPLEQISYILEENEHFILTEDKEENFVKNLENFKNLAKKEVKDTRRKSLNNTVSNIMSNIKAENDELEALTKRKSIIDCDFLNSEKKYSASSSVPRQDNSIPKSFFSLTDERIKTQYLKKAIENKTYLDRVNIYNEKKKYESELKLIHKLEKEKRDLYEKPTLSKNTKEIIKKKLNKIRPIYKRTKEVLQKKSEIVDKIKKNIDEEKNLALHSSPKYGVYEKERYNKWISEKIEWKHNIETRMSDIKKNRDRIETEGQNLLYKPTINKFSETLANNRNNETPNKTIYQRLYDKKDRLNQTMEDLKKSYCPTFNPTLNKPAKKGKVDHELNRSMIEVRTNYEPMLTKNTTRENKKPKSQEKSEDYKYENPDKDWKSVVDEINSNKIVKEKGSNLYKLNVRCTSAWDKDHLNVVVLNERMIELFSDQK